MSSYIPANFIRLHRIQHYFSLTVLTLLLVSPLSSVYGQDDSSAVQFSSDSKISVEGTSSLHDWNCQVESFSGEITKSESASNPLDGIQTVLLTAPIQNMECGKNTMNRKLREAFKAEDHPELTFSAKEITVTNEGSGSAPTLIARGNLTMAGVTRSIEVSATGEQVGDNRLKFSGQHELDMTDYKMDPPTAVFGTIRTGDVVTVHFEILTPNK